MPLILMAALKNWLYSSTAEEGLGGCGSPPLSAFLPFVELALLEPSLSVSGLWPGLAQECCRLLFPSVSSGVLFRLLMLGYSKVKFEFCETELPANCMACIRLFF